MTSADLLASYEIKRIQNAKESLRNVLWSITTNVYR